MTRRLGPLDPVRVLARDGSGTLERIDFVSEYLDLHALMPIFQDHEIDDHVPILAAAPIRPRTARAVILSHMAKRKGPYFKSLATSTYGENRRHDAAMNDDDTAAFLLGAWIDSPSSNVKEARYVSEELLLEVQFKDGSVYQFFGITHEQALAYAKAPSKGGMLWDFRRQGIEGFKAG